jgi:hypothetical protein
MNNQEDGSNRWYHTKDFPLLAVAFLTLIAVCVYACFAKQQVTETQNSNKLTSENFYVSSRPYTVWNDFSVYEVIVPSGVRKWEVNVKWQNLGNVPARFVVTNCKEIIVDTSEQPAFSCTPISNQGPAGVMGPKQTLSFSGPQIDKDKMADTTMGKAFVYVFGYITYWDNIRDTIGHQTRFCDGISEGALISQGTTTMLPANAFAYKGCEDKKWNCFDSDCPPL